MDNYIGEIRVFAGNFAPENWAFCDGSLVSISENPALFQLVGTTYGGDGQTTFALPNLQSRVVVGQGVAATGTNYPIGMSTGVESVTLTTLNMATHAHPVSSSISAMNGGTPANTPANNQFGSNGASEYASPAGGANATLAPGSVTGQTTPVGNSAPHLNIQPVLATSYIIALTGIYPSQQ
ncbi:phage tail protein [Hymenobacter properus]|uniref:Phage tail protein n=1 Tax=Hymenobacter properus TaxID=2791026 RepID=A0A931BEP2_9BACT|nr:tail fiber protein [Hymenobacter properus]MBF9141098.1 phage tail protein [Hymenobacter properus]MBR7719907.1 phage tail protein [Microvirga sp. SRT04]